MSPKESSRAPGPLVMKTDVLRLCRKGIFSFINSTAWRRCGTARLARLLPLLPLFALPATVQAQFDCATNHGTITITGYSGSGGDVDIPSTLNTLPVTAIANYALANCTNLTSITIPNSVTSIGENAFSGCTDLQAITVNPLNKNYSSVDGVLLNKSQTTLVQCPGARAPAMRSPAVSRASAIMRFMSASISRTLRSQTA